MSTRITEQAAGMAARCRPSSASPHITNCARTLKVGFFFDGFGRHRIKDMQTGRVSNIGKLFLVHPDAQADEPLFSYRAFYASGLGEDFSADLNVTANSAVTSFGDTASEVPADAAKDQAIESAKDVLDPRRNWWERISRNLKELLHKPLNLMGLLKGAVIDATLEVLAPVRDSRFAAELLKTGGDTRIQGAIDFLNEVIRKVESQHGQPPLKHIELTVYGHDYGATLARAFLHELLSREPQPSGDTYSYQGIKLTILFAGLFDGVDRSHVDFPYLPLPLRTVLDDGGPLPDRVKQALHLVAGEEENAELVDQLVARQPLAGPLLVAEGRKARFFDPFDQRSLFARREKIIAPRKARQERRAEKIGLPCAILRDHTHVPILLQKARLV